MKIHQKFIVLAVTLCVGSGCRSASTAYLGSTPAAGKSRSFVSANPPGEPNRAVSEHDNGPNRASSESAESAADDSGMIQQVSDQTTESQVTTTSDPANVRLSVRAAIETGLAQNPDLIALRQTEGVGVAAVGVAQTYPFNPWVQVQATPYQQAQTGGPGTTYHYVLMMQQIQLGHQQQYREQAACTALNGIRWNVVQAELLNVAQTERLYFTAVYQKGLRDLANIYAENNRQLLDILERQKEIGQATGADVAIVRLDARSTRQQQRVAEANYQTALLDLKRQLFMPADADIDLDADVTNWGWRQATEAELATMASSRPDVMAARADADTARANANFANEARIPDLQIGPYYQRTDTGITYLGFRAQMDIPVVNDGVPLLRQRQAELFQRSTMAQQLANRAQLEAQAAADRYERARQIRVDSGDSLKMFVPVELQRLEEQFQANEVDILRVLQAHTSLLQSQRADLDAMNELMQAAVAVTAASGMPLESLTIKAEPHLEQPITE